MRPSLGGSIAPTVRWKEYNVIWAFFDRLHCLLVFKNFNTKGHNLYVAVSYRLAENQAHYLLPCCFSRFLTFQHDLGSIKWQWFAIELLRSNNCLIRLFLMFLF